MRAASVVSIDTGSVHLMEQQNSAQSCIVICMYWIYIRNWHQEI